MTNNLVNQIKYYAQKYYEGNPEISDSAFDALVEELRSIDPENKVLHATGWGFDPSRVETLREKFVHRYGNMNSIERKPRSISEIPQKYIDGIVRITPKYDGLSGAAYFSHGELYMGLTRGDGSTGINVTDKVKILLHGADHLRVDFTGAIRGEFVMPNEKWEKYKELHPDAKDPRNSAAGIINRDGISDLEFLDFVVYKIIGMEGHCSISTIQDLSMVLNEIFGESGVTISKEIYATGDQLSQELLETFYNDFNQEYPCDGCVITYGLNSNFEYDEIAYKFKGDTKITEVQYIEWNRSRTGKMVPTLVLEPVWLSGAMVSRATAFNAKYVKDNGICKGCRVEIERSGEVIPDVQRVVLIPAGSVADLPDVCPACGEKLVWEGANLWCRNPSCSATDLADLYMWMDTLGEVHGLGGSIKKDFINLNQWTSVEDLYNNCNECLMPDTPHAKKLIIEMMRKLTDEPVDPVRALVALNIPRLGWESAKKIVIAGIDLSQSPDVEVLTRIVGQATANSINDNREKLKRLQFVSERLSKPTEEEPKGSLGKVVITGKLSLKRADFEKIIVDAGYELDGAIRKDTKFLITNTPDSGSSKNKKADELGVKKITEEEFLNMIKG